MYYDTEVWNSEVSDVVVKLQDNFINELDTKQRDKVKELRCRVNGLLEPKHSDLFLLKWLKARKFDITAAEAMLRSHLNFRDEMRIDNIQNEYHPTDVLTKYVTLGVVGEDKKGSPVYIIPAGNLDIVGLIYSETANDILKFFTYNCEYAEILCNKLTEKHNKVIQSVTVIVDIDNFKLRDFIWKPVLELVTQALKILEANYPEVLRKCFIINAPKIFSVFWSMVKPLLREETRNKIIIYGKANWKDALLQDIEPNQLPKHWGGNLVDEIDGNPYCTSKVSLGGKIPDLYYLSKQSKDKNMKCTTVQRQSKRAVDIEVEQSNLTLSWAIQSEDKDIGFGVCYKPSTNSEVDLIPIERIQCQVAPKTGSLLCKETGTYSLIFDNTYSWVKSKKIYYDINVL